MPTTGITNSYDFLNNVRSVNDVFFQMVADSPTLLSLINYSSEPARGTKHEWLEDSLTPTASAITSFDTDGDGTGVNVASTAGFLAGDIIRFETSTGATETEVALIASVDSATDLTITRDYGGSTGVTLVVGDVVKLLTRPIAESTDPGTGDSQEPLTNFNYSQIFKETAQLSKTEAAIDNYGFSSIEAKLNYQVATKMKTLMYQMENSVIYGRRVARSASNKGTMGGILQYLAGGNVTAVGGALTATVLNNLIEDVYSSGGFSSNYAILVNEKQARKISGLNAPNVSNSPVRTSINDRSYGGFINRFVADLPVQNGFSANVVVSPIFPKDQLAFVDMSMINLKHLPGREFQYPTEDANVPGADYYRRQIIGEYTLEVMNGTKAHGLLTGLTI